MPRSFTRASICPTHFCQVTLDCITPLYQSLWLFPLYLVWLTSLQIQGVIVIFYLVFFFSPYWSKSCGSDLNVKPWRTRTISSQCLLCRMATLSSLSWRGPVYATTCPRVTSKNTPFRSEKCLIWRMNYMVALFTEHLLLSAAHNPRKCSTFSVTYHVVLNFLTENFKQTKGTIIHYLVRLLTLKKIKRNAFIRLEY